MQTLVFGAEGKVTAIYVKEGDNVKAGQLLAEIDKKSLSISLSQQALSIQNAKLNYNKLLNQYTAADKIKAQNDVDSIKNNLDIAKNDLQDLLSSQWNNIQVNSTKVQSLIISTKNSLKDIKNILDDINTMFGITHQDLENSVYYQISVNFPTYKSSASAGYYSAKNQFDQLGILIANIESQTTVPSATITNMQNIDKQLINWLSSTIDSAISAFKNSFASETLTQTFIDKSLSTLYSANSKVASYVSSINSNIESLKSISTDLQTKKNEISSYEAQLKVSQEKLQTILNWVKADDKQLQANAITQSSLSYQQTSQQLDNYQIIAPFDGTVDTIWFKVGDTVSYNAGSSANGITVSNPDAYEVNTLIDQIDVVKVMPGQPVEITFDAYPGYSITWTIASIDPTPVTSAGVVSYKAQINLQQITGKKIYDSMSANVNVIIDHKDNILLIPTIAIQTSGDTTFVWTQQGSKDIFLGITDGIQTEILSWLHVGDIVSAQAYQVQSAAKSTTFQPGSSWTPAAAAQQTQQSFRMLQGGGGRLGN